MSSIVDERGFNQGFELNSAQKARLQRRARAIVSEMRLPTERDRKRDVHILELGCGTGELAFELAKIAGARVTGVDRSQMFIDYASAKYRHPNLRFLVANFSDFSREAAQGKYDYIVGNGILHHLYYRLDKFLPTLASWLRPGGRLIFWEPNLKNPYVFLIFRVAALRRMARLEPEEMAFTPRFIKRKLTTAGFCQVRAITRDFLLPNTPARLISSVVKIGDFLENVPIVRGCAQSIFLTATASRPRTALWASLGED
jgi:2-polyprenyl-3-methyl-5-hydroxy-6-metoxy-1,4-benzoquinol methylase